MVSACPTECRNLCEPMEKEKADRLASLICISMSSMCDCRSFRDGIFVEVICDHEFVFIPYYLTDKGVHKEFSCFYIVRIFKYFCKKIFLYFFDGQVSI